MQRMRFSQAAGAKAAENENHQHEDAHQQSENFEDDYSTETEGQKRFRRAFRIVGWTITSVFALNSYYIYLDSSKRSESEKRLGFLPYFYDIPLFFKNTFVDSYNFLVKPPMPKMLPDNPPIRQVNKTLVLNFEGTLYSKDFEAGKGVVLHLRPGFQRFMEEISKTWEVVIFSDEDSQFLTEATLTIDPLQKYFMWVFGREFMVFRKNGYYKDLSLLNRDPKKVVVVDVNPNIYANNPENLVVVKEYLGSEEDNTLRYLTLYLNYLAAPEIRDVRKEIKKYGGNDSLESFKKEVFERIEKIKKGRSFFGSDNRKKRI